MFAVVAKAFPDALLDFQQMFPDEAACVAYLEELRWLGGPARSSATRVQGPTYAAPYGGKWAHPNR
mgnify:CR=1 FL=1